MHKLMILSFCGSTVALIFFSISLNAQFDSYFGWQVSAGVLFCDVAVSFLFYCHILTSPILLMILSIIGRGTLFYFWNDRWFFACSINYIIFAALLIYHIIDGKHPILTPDEALDKVVGSLETAMEKHKLQQANEKKQKT